MATTSEPYQFVKTNYTSDPVEIPNGFLETHPPDAKPVSVSRIDFASSPVPEYASATALVLDNVLSPSECAALVSLAERSAVTGGWRPALLNAGGYREVLATEVRSSDRIIWDSQEVVDRLWRRCRGAEGVEGLLGEIRGNADILGLQAAKRGEVWQFTRLNERMRFLRYREGQYFKPHVDGPYEHIVAGKLVEASLVTLQLYLSQDEELKGGATTFHPQHFAGSAVPKARLDVEPRAGRALIFQHRNLLHSGDDVLAGEKITLRTDLMYEFVEQDEESKLDNPPTTRKKAGGRKWWHRFTS